MYVRVQNSLQQHNYIQKHENKTIHTRPTKASLVISWGAGGKPALFETRHCIPTFFRLWKQEQNWCCTRISFSQFSLVLKSKKRPFLQTTCYYDITSVCMAIEKSRYLYTIRNELQPFRFSDQQINKINNNNIVCITCMYQNTVTLALKSTPDLWSQVVHMKPTSVSFWSTLSTGFIDAMHSGHLCQCSQPSRWWASSQLSLLCSSHWTFGTIHSRDLRSFEIRFDSKVMGRLENFFESAVPAHCSS